MDNQLSLNELVISMLNKDPFYGVFLLGVDKEYSDKVPTAGVTFAGGNYKMYVNRDFVSKFSLEEQQFVIVHECIHLIQKCFKRTQKHYHKMMWNVAMDIAVNQMANIKEDWEIAKGAATLKNVNKMYKLNMPPNESSEYYYNAMDQELTQEQKDNMEGNDHDYLQDMSEEEKEVLKQKIKETKEKVGQGKTPSGIEDVLEILNKKHSSLKQELKRFIASQINTSRKPTKNRINKRYGLPYEGTRLNRKLKLFVGVDTSGSVSDEMLKRVGSELNELASQGIELIVLQSDCEIQEIKQYKKSNLFKVKGRGGTSFVPYFEGLKKYKDVDGILIFSDMEVYKEDIIRPKQKVLWVSFTEEKAPYEWGSQVSLRGLE